MSAVVAVCRSGSHTFSKEVVDEVRLVAGLGVDGDAHAGTTVQHLSRVRRDPTQPNLRQVHLVHRELFDQVAESGFTVGPGQMGENVTTEGVDLLGLPTGTRLRLGADAVVRVTGLRNPCGQLNGLSDGMMARLVHRADDGSTVREAGVMAVVEVGGVVRAGDPIAVELPSGAVEPLVPV